MLNKIKSFNNLFQHLLISEGYFHIPEKVLSEIKKDFSDVIRFKDDNVPVKNYKLDFSDTNYDFLNDLEPHPSVDVKFTNGEGRIKGSFHITDKSRFAKNKTLVQIDFSTDTPERILSDVIEHELSHFVQILIKKYNEEKKGYGSLGGMPSKKLLKGLEKDKKKISIHSHIPTEIYPDLLSSIRELQSIFNEKYKNGSEKEKKQFFLNFLKSVKDKKRIGKKAYYVFSDIEGLSKALYRDFVKKAYVAFVNG
jgi:hypothetical protein